MAVLANRYPACWSDFTLSVNNGTNDGMMLPSANISRARLAIRKDTQNASRLADAPKKCAMTISRMNPNAREIPVPKLKPNSLRYIRLMGHSHQGEKDGI